MDFKEKVIVIDWAMFLHMSAHASEKHNMPIPTYLAMAMILGNLKKIGLEPWDEVIIGCDHMSSWRKEFIPQLKEDRKEAKEKSGMDWDKIYSSFNDLLDKIKISTNWNIVEIPHVEYDDIASVCCRYYKDKEVVLLTMDSDLELCWHYNNVKIFSPHRLMKRYKVRPEKFNVYKLLAKMVANKGHNNLNISINTEEDYKLKEKCIDLINLPEWVEQSIKENLEKLQSKSDDINNFPFHKLKETYGSLYNNKNNIITYEQCIKKEERKKKKKKLKKAKKL